MSVPTANFPPNPRPVDPFDGVIETVEKITEEYFESGREDINQLMDLVETAVPFDRDPDCWCYTLAERAFCRLTGIEFDENGEPDWVKREMLPGPRRRFSIDRAKPPYIIPRKDKHRNFGHWFPRGTVSLVAGASGTGKTVLLSHLLEAYRQGQPVLGHPVAQGEYRFLLVDRTCKELRESVEDKNLNVEAILSRAREVDFLDESKEPAEILDGALKGWELEGAPDVVVLEGADMWCGESADIKKTVRFLKSLIQVATAWNVAVVASVGSPKQKPNEQYAMTRDKVFGSIGWGRTCSTIMHISLTAPEDPDSVRKVQTLPRTGRSETLHFKFEDGLLVYCEPPTDEPQNVPDGVAETKAALKTDTQSQMIMALANLPVGTVLNEHTFPWLSKAAVFKNLKALSQPEAGWVGKNEAGKWVCVKRQD
jgi:AAA domain